MNGSSKSMVAFSLFVGAATSWAATEITWDQSTCPPSYAGGAVTVEYDEDGAVTSLAADPAAVGDLSVKGEPVTLSPEGTLTSLSSLGILAFENLSVDKAIRLTGKDELTEWKVESTLEGTADDWSKVIVPCPSASIGVVAKGMLLASVTNVTARYDKAPDQTTGGVPCDAVTTFFENNGKVCTFEIQKRTSSATLRGIKIELSQNDLDIMCRVVGTGHKGISGTDTKEGDFRIEENHDSWTKSTSKGCFVTNLVLFCESVAQHPRVKVSSTNELGNVALKVGMTSPALVDFNDQKSFPTSGTVEVGPYGCVSLYKPSNQGGVLDGMTYGVPFTVRKGGQLIAKTAYVLKGDNTSITLDGGLLSVSPQTNPGADSSVYVDDFVLRNGARIAGADVRVRASTSLWKIEGSSPSFCDVGLICWRYSEKSTSDKIVFDVDDVTSDETPDFTISGRIVESSTGTFGQVPIVKQGAGTMRLTGSYVMNVVPTRLEGGTFLVDGDILDSGCDFALAGGTLAFADGTTNAAQGFTLEADSGLSVGEDASVSFADMSAVEWADGKRLVFSGDLEKCSVRFGTSSAGLTTSQLRKIAFAGDRDHRAALDDDGYLCKVPKPGLMLLFR